MNIKDVKKALRVEMLNKRALLDPSTKLNYDAFICEKLAAIILEQQFKVVHAYIPIAHEINILSLLEDLIKRNITVVCPKTLPKRQLENRVLESLQQLEIGVMGTKHPLKNNIYTGNYDLIIIPGLAYDDRNYRLGYGGGYYDGFLTQHPKAFKLGIFYPFQYVDKIPLEPHDQRLDDVLIADFIIKL